LRFFVETGVGAGGFGGLSSALDEPDESLAEERVTLGGMSSTLGVQRVMKGMESGPTAVVVEEEVCRAERVEAASSVV
jgi:hypothetical protein